MVGILVFEGAEVNGVEVNSFRNTLLNDRGYNVISIDCCKPIRLKRRCLDGLFLRSMDFFVMGWEDSKLELFRYDERSSSLGVVPVEFYYDAMCTRSGTLYKNLYLRDTDILRARNDKRFWSKVVFG